MTPGASAPKAGTAARLADFANVIRSLSPGVIPFGGQRVKASVEAGNLINKGGAAVGVLDLPQFRLRLEKGWRGEGDHETQLNMMR